MVVDLDQNHDELLSECDLSTETFAEVTPEQLEVTRATLVKIYAQARKDKQVVVADRRLRGILHLVRKLKDLVCPSGKMARRDTNREEDRRTLASCGLIQLREHRRAVHVNPHGSSIPVLPPAPGDGMGSKCIEAAPSPLNAVVLESAPSEANDACAESSKLAYRENQYTTRTKVNSMPLHVPVPEGCRPLHRKRSCHICRQGYAAAHHFYDQLCPSCGDLNFEKRTSTLDLSGKVAIVTGARVKIGFCVSLKLLRSGAFVLATTRFPKDAIKRYRMEPDFQEWRHRLHVYGLDFRDIPLVHRFCAYVKATYPRLDMVVNNAAQTVRRPPVYYQHLLREEMMEVDEDVRSLLVDYAAYEPRDRFILLKQKGLPLPSVADGQGELARASEANVCTSVVMSQVRLTEEDDTESAALFPPGQYDVDLQQVDLRQSNSWTQRIGEVSTVEMIECHAINAFAPFVLCSELRSMLADPRFKEEIEKDGRYIVNVSAMEGQFYRHKTPNHPHTNMSKCSLNMMTRTVAQDMVHDGIYVNCVDTGWITDEHPEGLSTMYTEVPLDEWDAAMRILDPIFMGVRNPTHRHYGVFFKNYRETRW